MITGRDMAFVGVGIGLAIPLIWGTIYVFRRPIQQRATRIGGQYVRDYLSRETGGIISTQTVPNFQVLTDGIALTGANAALDTIGVPP